MSIKVSVVVAAYQPGDGIDRVISSLDAQTLPQEQFETIIVDDGSPDDTYSRLEAIRDTHDNVTIHRIENSGWPSRPRNIGLEMARGEYVLFMDHDDYIYPEGLERSYDFGAENHADVISPKESKNTEVAWGIENYTENVANARESRGIESLLPMMPHKLYRRDFLNEHGIRFPEGRRMLWEDVYFNVAAYRHASVISILSDTPVYKWVRTGTNNSSTYGPQTEEFWDKLAALFEFLEAELAGDEFRADRECIILHQYRTRALGRFYSALPDDPDDGAGTPMPLRRILDIVSRHVPEALEQRLGKYEQARSQVMRGGRLDLMRQIRDIDSALIGLSRTERVEWKNRCLEIDAVTAWNGVEKSRLALKQRQGRIFRELPSRLAQVIPERVLDLTDDLPEANTMFTLRSRQEHVTWPVPTSTTVNLETQNDGSVDLTVRATAVIDLRDAAMGAPAVDPSWDLHARNSFIGIRNHRALRTATTPKVAMMDGTVAIAYTNVHGHLSLDLGQTLRSVVTDSSPDVKNAVVEHAGVRTFTFVLSLRDIHIEGRTRVGGEIELHTVWARFTRRAIAALARRLRMTPPVASVIASPAVLIADETGARLEGTLRGRAGSYLLTCRFGAHTSVTPVRVRITRTGHAEFSRA